MLCTSGTSQPDGIADTSTHFKWTCVGQHGGQTRSCEKLKPINGLCNNSTRGHGCLSGVIDDVSESE